MAFLSKIDKEDIELLPKAELKGRIHVIDHVGPAYYSAIARLKKERILGFDTETKPNFHGGSVHNMIALLQLSTATHSYLFRLSGIGMRRSLRSILASPHIIKVGAAVSDDVRGLKEYHGFEAAGFVDLQKIVKNWGIEDTSVKKMAAIILGVKVSKAQQLSNWEAHFLTDSQKNYAALDAQLCRDMYIKLLDTEKPDGKENLSL